eukprot:5393940-Prymnesium_polylepis.1
MVQAVEGQCVHLRFSSVLAQISPDPCGCGGICVMRYLDCSVPRGGCILACRCSRYPATYQRAPRETQAERRLSPGTDTAPMKQ